MSGVLLIKFIKQTINANILYMHICDFIIKNRNNKECLKLVADYCFFKKLENMYSTTYDSCYYQFDEILSLINCTRFKVSNKRASYRDEKYLMEICKIIRINDTTFRY
jgi:hypothetical protein